MTVVGSEFVCLEEGRVFLTSYFANDVLLFYKAKNSQMRVVLDTLSNFCATSGLKVNVDKSRAM